AVAVGGGTLSFAAPVLTWTGALAVGASASITYSVTVHDPDTGDKLLVNTATSTAAGSSCPPDAPVAACSADVDVLVPALSITKTADTATVVAGSAVHYTVTVANTGQTAYAPATVTDSLVGVLDDATFAGASATSGTVAYAAGTLTWSGGLALGATATITYTVTTDLPATGDRTLTNAVLSDSPGSDCVTGSESHCTTSVSVLVPALVVTKTPDASEVVAGGTLGYTISATNAGQADYSAATLSDSLAGLLDDATYDNDAVASSGVVGYAAGTLTWTGALPRGATVTIGYSVTTPVVDSGDALLTNRVVSSSAGSTCPAAGGPAVGCATATPVAPRTLELSGLTGSFTLSGVPHAIASSVGAVRMTVTTNSAGGYGVSVLPATASMTGATPGNTDTIPVELLQVRETGTSTWHALSPDVAVSVHQQDLASALGGDAVSNDFRLQLPNVLPDRYTSTLDYIATAQ
ncbi:MAG: hypothetical protein ABI776_01020, partial [Nocardioidaceae bacterium]